jgi:hypothetical protein
MANHNLGTIRGTIEIDYDGAGIVRAIRDTEGLSKRQRTLEKGADAVLSGFAKSAKGAALFGGALNLVMHAGQLVVSTMAILGPIVSAALATGPGIALAFASALVITKVALMGVGDALKAAAEGGDAFEEALKKLSPEAQKFARAYQKTIPVLKEVQRSIQDAFFQNTAGQIAGVVTRIASLRAQATGVSFALGQIVQNIVQFATSGKSIENVRNILSGLNGFLLQIRNSIGPVVAAFISLGAQVAGFGQSVGASVNGALAKLAAWLSSIDVAALFERALPILRSLGDLLANVGDIFSTLFSGITANGDNAASILAILTGELAAFLHTAEGQAALASLGQAMQAIGGAAGQIFMALLKALAPTIVALAPGLTQLANQIAGVLVPAINALNPLLVDLAGFLSDNMGWIGPLLGVVLGLAAAYKVYATVLGVINTLKALELAAFIRSTAAWIASTAAMVANKIALVAGAVAMGIVRAATIAWTAVQWLLNAALIANPIGLIVIGIAALVAIIVLVATKTQFFQTIWAAVWGFMKAVGAWFAGPFANFFVQAWNKIVSITRTLWSAIVSIWNGIKAGITGALNGIKAATAAIWNAILAAIRAYINAYKAIIMAGVNAARAVWSAALNAVRAVARAVWAGIVALIRGYINQVKSTINGVRTVIATVRNAFNSARSAVASALSSVVSLVRGLPGRVSGALGGLGSLLFGKGQQLIRGFINGIGSMLGAVKSKVNSIVGAVTRFLPGSPAKEGPLSGKGYVLLRARRFMNDFAQGLQDGSQKPVAAMMGAVTPVARATVPAGSGTRSGASTAPTTPNTGGGTRVYRVALGDKEFAELVVDAVTGAPKAVNNAAKEGSRRSAWAGSGR